MNELTWFNDFLEESIPLWRQEPSVFMKEVLSFKPDDWQNEVACDVRDYPRTAVKSGQGVGKTAIEAGIIFWFLVCHPFSRVVATAPTRTQLHDVLWAELDKWMNNSILLPQLLKWTKTHVCMRGYENRWFAVARTSNKPENMQGFHEENMLIVVDEASGVADSILDAIQGTLTGKNNKLLYMGNPTKITGGFHDAFTINRTLFHCHTVNSEDSPRTNKENIEALKRKYGADSNVVRVRVQGEFPLADDDVFLSSQIVEQATMTEPPKDEKINRITLGVDVARYGKDETVIAQNINNCITLPVVVNGQNLMQTVGNIVKLYRQLICDYSKYKGMIYVNIDDTGLGGGVTDRLTEVKSEEHLSRLVITPVNAASRVPDTVIDDEQGKVKACEKYDNLTTYMWGTIRDLLLDNQLSLPNDNDLIAQLSCRKYRLTSRGKLQLETKEEMSQRGIHSPDRGDAVALALFRSDKNITNIMPIKNELMKESHWR